MKKYTLLIASLLLSVVTSGCDAVHEAIAKVPSADVARAVDSACRLVEVASVVTEKVAYARTLCAKRHEHSLDEILEAVKECELQTAK